MGTLWTYLYNSQQKVELLPDKDGYYLINGNKVRADELVVAPFKNTILKESTRFYLVPPNFPEPHTLEICQKKLNNYEISKTTIKYY
ncbi:abortive infection system toxin AbiGii family protein [Anaerosacchariphilus polymeriproducens]|uniref:Uncharacterized protein n=1 Tax=Anaerosacchariphilus polymeriproducens TaxID=1812858 RepID=A0A371AYE4_9FIRM|nr:abortive infection system toxin AbiGii family protein [Anaerosacchariphilus polymeriproducens]RDU24586.1 hypothetical protein DWV06_03730 [Anaerosacchariphilus polymeriproducens]